MNESSQERFRPTPEDLAMLEARQQNARSIWQRLIISKTGVRLHFSKLHSDSCFVRSRLDSLSVAADDAVQHPGSGVYFLLGATDRRP